MTPVDERVRILGTPLTAQRFDSAIDRMIEAARTGQKLRAHFCTVHTIVEARSSVPLRTAFESAQMLCMDGMPLVWVAHWRGAPWAERVCGPDAMLALADRGRPAGLRHYFLGGGPGIPELLAGTLTARFPGLVVAGTHSPPFGTRASGLDVGLINKINEAAPHILWIGLGSPKQELWAVDHADALNAPVVLPVGAAFDFHSGRIRRAPVWMQRSGLEWLFRLAVDPRRLGWRYARTNLLFLWLLGREALGR